MKENLLKIKKIILENEILYWISRHLVLLMGIYLSLSAMLQIPKVYTYIVFICTLEAIAVGLSSISNWVYTQQRLNGADSNIITASIFLAVHILVALSAFVMFSDLL